MEVPSYQVKHITVMYNLSLMVYKQVTKWLPSFIGKMYGSYQVSRLPDITEEVICTIYP